jgi:hypothetical protein
LAIAVGFAVGLWGNPHFRERLETHISRKLAEISSVLTKKIHWPVKVKPPEAAEPAVPTVRTARGEGQTAHPTAQAVASPLAARPVENLAKQRPAPVAQILCGRLKNLLAPAEAMESRVDRLDVRSVQVGTYSARALINDHIVQQGEKIACGKKRLLTFCGVREGNMIFEDDAGNVYRRDLHRMGP